MCAKFCLEQKNIDFDLNVNSYFAIEVSLNIKNLKIISFVY